MLLSITGFESLKTVQIRIYNKTTATEVVAWTATGVSERADGEGYSVYFYSYALVAGSEYIVDWKDNSTPIQTASESISVLQSGVATITAKLPTNYIMGSSVQTAKDDVIDDIKTEVLTHPTLTEIEATTVLAKEATINTKIPTALTFTGSDVKATLDGEEVTPTTLSKTGYALSATGIQAIWDALTSAFTTVGSIGKKLADWVVGTIDTYTGNTKQTGDSFTRLGAPAGASVSADIAAIPTTSYTSTLTALSNAIAALQTDLGDPSVAETTIYAQILVLRAYVDELETRLTAERAIKLDNLDATISSRSTLTAQQVWEYATRTLTSIGAIVADIWSYATRKLTSRNIATGEDIAKEQTLLSGVGTGAVLIPGATDDGDTITLYYGNSYDGLQFILGSAWSAYLGAGNEVYIAAKKRYSDVTMLFNVKGTIVDQPTGTVSFDLSPANMTQTPSDNYILEVQVIKPDGTVVKSAIIRRLELKDRVRK